MRLVVVETRVRRRELAHAREIPFRVHMLFKRNSLLSTLFGGFLVTGGTGCSGNSGSNTIWTPLERDPMAYALVISSIVLSIAFYYTATAWFQHRERIAKIEKGIDPDKTPEQNTPNKVSDAPKSGA